MAHGPRSRAGRERGAGRTAAGDEPAQGAEARVPGGTGSAGSGGGWSLRPGARASLRQLRSPRRRPGRRSPGPHPWDRGEPSHADRNIVACRRAAEPTECGGLTGFEVRHHPGDHDPEELAADTAHCWIGLPVAAPPPRRTGCRCSNVGSLTQVDDGQLHRRRWREERPPGSTGSGRKAATPPPESGDEAAPAGAAAAGAAAGAGRRRRPPSPRKATTDAGAGSPDSDEKAAGAAAAGAAAGAGRRRRPPSPRKATTDAGAGSPDAEREGRRGRGRRSRSRGGSSASSAQLEEGRRRTPVPVRPMPASRRLRPGPPLARRRPRAVGDAAQPVREKPRRQPLPDSPDAADEALAATSAGSLSRVGRSR